MAPHHFTPHTADARVGMGRGGSTIALAALVREVVSIKHDATFAAGLASRLPSNVMAHVVPPEFGTGKIWQATSGQFTSYIRQGGQCGPFDAVLVDGRARMECALEAAQSRAFSDGGWLFLHDSRRPRYREHFHELAAFYDLMEEAGSAHRGLTAFRRK